MFSRVKAAIGRRLARYLAAPVAPAASAGDATVGDVASALRPGDVLLVDGRSRFSTAIKYLTQSSWSHAALYVGCVGASLDEPTLLEADVVDGVVVVPVRKYDGHRLRICRPVGLSDADRVRMISTATERLGHAYDLRNVVDLARYLLPTPPVPTRLRRKLIAFGSGDPTRAICSTLIAQAFQSVRYPILPTIERQPNGECDACVDELLHIRHHSLFTPRDFDLSPFFEIVKPRLAAGFDYRRLRWGDGAGATRPASSSG